MRIEESLIDNRKTIYYYDDNDLHIRTTDYDENGKISGDIQYHHNNQNECDSWRVFNSNGDLTYRFEVIFDEFGREKEIKEFDQQNILQMRTVNNYDEDDRFIAETLFDAEENEISRDEFLEE
jgi:antitoxin component YwqK of YwqJK toxin-antitoxin module